MSSDDSAHSEESKLEDANPARAAGEENTETDGADDAKIVKTEAGGDENAETDGADDAKIATAALVELNRLDCTGRPSQEIRKENKGTPSATAGKADAAKSFNPGVHIHFADLHCAAPALQERRKEVDGKAAEAAGKEATTEHAGEDARNRERPFGAVIDKADVVSWLLLNKGLGSLGQSRARAMEEYVSKGPAHICKNLPAPAQLQEHVASKNGWRENSTQVAEAHGFKAKKENQSKRSENANKEIAMQRAAADANDNVYPIRVPTEEADADIKICLEQCLKFPNHSYDIPCGLASVKNMLVGLALFSGIDVDKWILCMHDLLLWLHPGLPLCSLRRFWIQALSPHDCILVSALARFVSPQGIFVCFLATGHMYYFHRQGSSAIMLPCLLSGVPVFAINGDLRMEMYVRLK